MNIFEKVFNQFKVIMKKGEEHIGIKDDINKIGKGGELGSVEKEMVMSTSTVANNGSDRKDCCSTEEMKEDPKMTEGEWMDEFSDILDGVDHKGDFCFGKEVTDMIPRFSPQIQIQGMEENEHMTFPMMDTQAKRLISFAEKAPFGKGLKTVLDENVRKAWQIDASKVLFLDSDKWQIALNQIVSKSTACLGISGTQQSQVVANLYKLLLYEPGGHFNKHKDTEKEPGMFGTLIIQLPSKFSGGALVIQHGGETRKIDFSSQSSTGYFATAFYSDCTHELLAIESGWRLCLAYNLVMRPTTNCNFSHSLLPSATALMAQTHQLRALSIQWKNFFKNTFGYLLEHDYTETNLHFFNLKGRDKEVTDTLRGVRDADGKPLFVVCLILLEKHETGEPACSGWRNYYDDSDDNGSHEMDHIYDTDCGVRHWIGPDDLEMSNCNLEFDFKHNLLNADGADLEELFGEDPSHQEYERYTGNAGPTLEYWYYRSAVVFWPRDMNLDIVKGAGLSYILSYLKIATDEEKIDLCEEIVKKIERKKIPINHKVLGCINNCNNRNLLLRTLKSISIIPSDKLILNELVNISSTKLDEVKDTLLTIISNSTSQSSSSYQLQALPNLLHFLEAMASKVPIEFYSNVRKIIALGAVNNKLALKGMKTEMLQKLVKICFESGEDIFVLFYNAIESDSGLVSCAVKILAPTHAKHPLVIKMANLRASALYLDIKDGPPEFSWKQSHASFPGSQSDVVNAFLKSELQSQTFNGFNGISHARNWASKYFGGYGTGSGYSATASPGGIGKNAFVTVKKTQTYHSNLKKSYRTKLEELQTLKKTFQDDIFEVNMDDIRQKRKLPSTNNTTSSKKSREVIEIDD